MKIILLSVFLGIVSSNRVYTQDENIIKTEYKTIAEGTNSPIPDLQIVCFNKSLKKLFSIDEQTN